MFDYLDYKNKIPLEKCLIDIPKINPLSVNYEKFWIHEMKRKQIEGHWVEHENEWKWIPGVVVQYCNLFKIERKSSKGGAKGKVIDKPDLRDIEWIKGYIYSVARGFSGFADDDEYTCHRVLKDPNHEELIRFLPKNVRESLYNKEGKLKTYVDALPYLYRYFDRNLGKPLFFNSAKNVIEIGARNYGKDLREDTIVYTEHGAKEIKDLKVGEKIYDDSGELTTVTNKFSFTDQLQYEVTLQDGRKIYCGEGHRWGVYHRGKYKVVDLKYILNTKYKTKRKNGYWEYSFRIPLTKPVNFKEVDTGIDSYLLGLWLGDGTSRETQFTTIDPEIIDYLKKFCLENKLELSNNGITYRIKRGKHKNFILDYLKNNNLILNKHIPKIFFTASKKQRLELLQGLLDTDGSISKNGEIEFSNKNEKLIDDVMLLCHSLGIKCYKRKRKTNCRYKSKIKECESFRLLIHTCEKVFKLKRKLDRLTEAKSKKAITNRESIAIVDIKPTEIKPSYCITVDNNSHLFLAGDFIVTHNTMFSANICAHNFLTDGVVDFDDWYNNYFIKPKDDRVVYTTQTLIGAIDAKYVNNLTKHLKTGLDNLPGSYQLGDKLYPPPLSKNVMGSWVVGKNIEARYQEKVGGKWEWKGTGSSFAMRSFKDNPFAANGLRYGLGLIDEVGFMGNLLDTLGQLHECTTVDGEKYGTIWMTGTGGDMVSGATEAAMKVFYDGDAFDCLTFDDVFENKGKIGLFIPAWMTLSEYRDELGNINKELAIKKLLKEREIVSNAKTKDALYSLLQMKPLVPSEAFLVLEGNIFPIGELKEHLANLESSSSTRNLGNTGMMYRDDNGKPYFKVDLTLKPADYPTKAEGNSEGCVVVWEEPIDNPPYGAYVAGIDPYDQDKAENSVSYGSMFVYKRFISADQTYHIPVAEYTARPQFANDFYEQCRRLLEWYNAKALYENQNPGIKKYFDTKFCTYLLHKQPNIIKSISPNSNVNRQYGIHMTKPIKDELEIMLRDWLKTEIDEGVMQLTKIMSIPLLKELIAYNSEGNFDRVIAFMLVVLQDVEMHKIKVREEKVEKRRDAFFDKKLFIK